MENREGESSVTENQKKLKKAQKPEDVYYNEIIEELFKEIKVCLDEIWNLLGEARKNEKYFVANIRSNIDSAKDFLGEHYKPEFYEYQVEAKLECVQDELKCIIYLLKKGEENEIWKAREWLPGIAKKTEKIRTLVSLCSTPPEEKAEEMVESKELRQYFVKECVLVSPMIVSLKKSYDHLPSNLRMCLLCLAPFPENFIIKKRLLIYWWMAEGFVTKVAEKSAEEVGEVNFMELIHMGFIQAWYEGEGETKQASVKGCKVHPWIRVMLVSIAMEAQMFEFYARQHGVEIGWTRVCLYDGESNATLLKSANNKSNNERLKELKVHFETYKSWVPMNDNEVHYGQIKLSFGFMYLVDGCLRKLDSLRKDINLSNTNPWTGDNYETFCMRCERLETEYIKLFTSANHEKRDVKQIDRLCRKQKKLLKDFDELSRWIERWVYDLEMVPTREKKRGELVSADELFRGYDLNVEFPSLMMKKKKQNGSSSSVLDKQDSDDWYYKWEKLLAIINFTQNNLTYMEREWLEKLTNLRTLHLGRWQQDSYIEVEDAARLLTAFFKVAKHLKYLSLRGISNITQLPPTISKCHNLQILDLKDCCDLQKLPSSEIGSLHNLTHFDISQCKQLHKYHSGTLVGRLESLQTLKGIALERQEDERCVSELIGLRKLSIILPARHNTRTINLQFLSNLRVLTITWRTMRENSTLEYDRIELPPRLRKLDLRTYPATTWPDWLKKHHELDTLYINQGNIKSFPNDLHMPKLRVLRLKHLRLDKDIKECELLTLFPSLNYLMH